MGNRIYITIENRESLIDILQEGKKKGLIKVWSVEKIDGMLKQKTFPIQIPVELDNLIDLVSNPIVKKMAGSKVDNAVGICLQRILEAD